MEPNYSTLKKSSANRKRLSSPGYLGDIGDNLNTNNITNSKLFRSKIKRNVRSMNETIEVMADQVEEDTSVSKKKINQLFYNPKANKS